MSASFRTTRRSRVIKRTLPSDELENGIHSPSSQQLVLSRTVDLNRRPSGMTQHHSLQAIAVQVNNSFIENANDDSPSFGDFDQDFGTANANEDGEEIDVTEISPGALARRLKRIQEWLPYRSEYLNETLRIDGQCGVGEADCCPKSPNLNSGAQKLFRCRDCRSSRILCEGCILTEHENNTLHRIQIYDGYWRRIALSELNLVFQLGHPRNLNCPCPTNVVKNIVVYHTNGVHRVNVRFCTCHDDEAPPRRVQMMRERWFPASQTLPSTAFTFDVLDLFLELTYQSKINAHDFCRSLERFTDNTGLYDVPDRYEEFLRVVREYGHLLLLKRGGRGHIDDGIESTGQGELAVECPACPHPGMNLLNDWQLVGEDERWLYGLNLAMDANFRLKQKDRNVEDIELGPGWAYFVDDREYKEEIQKHPQPMEKSECSSTHQAIERATSKLNEGYSVTGIAAAICSRHGFVRPRGVGNLQRGERYANMDYVFLSGLIGTTLMFLSISYDIACQWHKNLRSRVARFPDHMQTSFLGTLTRFFIPKFHMAAHGRQCQGEFSLNWRRYVGRTDGEGIERGWSHINPLATAVREMGGALRHETFDVHWSAENWRKLASLGKTLKSKLLLAIKNSKKHARKHQKQTDGFDESIIAKWNKEIESWERDTSGKRNPYLEPEATQSVAEVSRQLAEEEDISCLSSGSDLDASPSAFILAGIELEDQIILFQDAQKKRKNSASASTVTNLKSLQDRRTALQKKTISWIERLTAYVPIVTMYSLMSSKPSPSTTLELEESSLEIYLPSSLRTSDRKAMSTNLEDAKLGFLVFSELKIRLAQMQDSIGAIKRLLRTRHATIAFRRRNLRGQKSNTRARSTLTCLQAKIDYHANRYRRARSALLILDPEGEWRTQYKNLSAVDIRGPFRDSGSDDDDDGDGDESGNPRSRKRSKKKGHSSLGQGHHTDSWIWSIGPIQCYSTQSDHGAEATTQEPETTIADDEIVSVLWARGRARAERWVEEVALVLEEMRRTLVFCESKSTWWRERISIREGGSNELKDGIRSYAFKQANMWESLGSSFAQQWAPVIKTHDLPSDWPSRHRDIVQVVIGPVDSAIGRNLLPRVKKALRLDIYSQPLTSIGTDEMSDSSDSESDF